MKAEFRIISLGACPPLVIEASGGVVLATCAGFHGRGPSEEAAIDDLIARVRGYNAAAVDFVTSFEPGGRHFDEMRALKAEVNRVGALRGAAP